MVPLSRGPPIQLHQDGFRCAQLHSFQLQHKDCLPTLPLSAPPLPTCHISRALTMADLTASRFTPQNKSTHERLSTTTVGLVALSDFRKRRAEVLEQQEREAREAAISGTSTPDASSTSTPDNAGSDTAGGAGARRPLKRSKQQQLKQKQKKTGKKLLSFDDDDDGYDNGDDRKDDSRKKDEGGGSGSNEGSATKPTTESPAGDTETRKSPHPKVRPNAAVGVIPRAVTKAALLKEATEREALRREFVSVQEAVKATEIAIPFIFYDGSNVTGGTVRVRKGDFVWVLLDKSRKVGAERRVGERGNPRRAWARVGVDDLMLVRDNIIIPHVSLVPTICYSTVSFKSRYSHSFILFSL